MTSLSYKRTKQRKVSIIFPSINIGQVKTYLIAQGWLRSCSVRCLIRAMCGSPAHSENFSNDFGFTRQRLFGLAQ
jgi:hypothetical protein